ncbi:MAG: hypothetical protein ACW9W3_09880 [Candidatus Nitrosopumilus sp. bin_68KS]
MLVDCPWMKDGKQCGKKGHLVLESPRKKQRRRSRRNANQKHKDYDTSGRPRGQYYRVHHYVYENGKRKSKFCYLGNFDGSLKKLKKIQTMIEDDKNFQSEKVQTDIKFWIDDAIKEAEEINLKSLKPEYVDGIFSTIRNAQLCIIRKGFVWQKYI